MIIFIIILFVAIIALVGMVTFRAWEIKSGKIPSISTSRNIFPEIYFRHTEKIMLYLAKHTIQWVVLVVVKYWFIFEAKTKKWLNKKLPQIRLFLEKFSKKLVGLKKLFAHKSVIELKNKIRHVRERVKKEHEKEHTEI